MVLLICALGTLRIGIAIVVDLLRPVITFAELATDVGILIVFISLLFIVNRRSAFKEVHPVFGLLIISLLGVNFLQFGGVQGTNCFNYYTGIYVTVMLFSGLTLYSLLFFQLSFLAGLIYLVYIHHPFYQSLLLFTDTESSTEFIFALLSVSVFTFYLKRITLSEIKKSESKTSELSLKIKESKKLNRQLASQADELKKTQELLKKEVNQRIAALEIRQHAIEQYIHHNTTTLRDPLLLLSSAVTKLEDDSHLCTLLKISNAELNGVITSINQTLQSEASLNRETLDRKL